MLELNKIHCGDCLELMKEIPNGSVDMILCDLPYGTTSCKWDIIIPFDKLWRQYKRIIKRDGVIVLFGKEPFSSHLRISCLEMYKYDWIWDKKIPSGMCNAKIMPMQQVELISVFINGKNFYYPQMTKRDNTIKSGGNKPSASGGSMGFTGEYKKVYDEKYPTTLLTFDKIRRGALHPTQKPVALCEYLIKTYSNEGNLVLDNCIGSGTTAVACKKLKRNFIGIELNEEYCKIAEKRLSEVI